MRFKVKINKKEVLAAGLLCLFGLVAALQVSANAVARVAGPGSGTLPVFIGAVLMVAGVLCLFRSRLSPDDDEGAEWVGSKWRSVCGVTGGVFTLLLLSPYAGVLPAVMVGTFIFVMGDRRHTPFSASVLAILVTSAVAAGLLVMPTVSPILLAWRGALLG